MNWNKRITSRLCWLLLPQFQHINVEILLGKNQWTRRLWNHFHLRSRISQYRTKTNENWTHVYKLSSLFSYVLPNCEQSCTVLNNIAFVLMWSLWNCVNAYLLYFFRSPINNIKMLVRISIMEMFETYTGEKESFMAI